MFFFSPLPSPFPNTSLSTRSFPVPPRLPTSLRFRRLSARNVCLAARAADETAVAATRLRGVGKTGRLREVELRAGERSRAAPWRGASTTWLRADLVNRPARRAVLLLFTARLCPANVRLAADVRLVAAGLAAAGLASRAPLLQMLPPTASTAAHAACTASVVTGVHR